MTAPEPRYAETVSPVAENPADAALMQADADFVDYFAFSEEKIFLLPDGKQQITHKILTEGDRARFQQATNKPVKMNRDGEATLRADPAEERKQLILAATVGWNFKRRESGRIVDVVFSKGTAGANLEQWLERADPRIIMDYETAIRKANPWLMADTTVEDIDKQIESLKEERERALEREARAAQFSGSSS